MCKYILITKTSSPEQVRRYLDGRRFDHNDPGSGMRLALRWKFLSADQDGVIFSTHSRYVGHIVQQLNQMLLLQMRTETGCHAESSLQKVMGEGQLGHVVSE